jgi:hypothetical protein
VDTGPSGPPDFGPNVVVFDPKMPMASIQYTLDQIFTRQGLDQFSTQRQAFLFKPGQYTAINANVGHYMHLIGLGQSPDDVTISGPVSSHDKAGGSALGNFWRGVENIAVTATSAWAVSQGTFLRRIHFKTNLALSEAGYSSGGFLADSKIDGAVSSGSQQQWFSRNVDWNSWSGGVWNMVFVGASKPPAGAWPTSPYSVVATAPVLREKPFLTIDTAGNYSVMVPALKKDSAGADWANGTAAGTARPIGGFYLARPDRDTAATINAALGQGKDLLLLPGIYTLDASINVTRAGTVVLGIGLPALTATTGAAALTIADVDGVSVGGVMIDAGDTSSPTLVQVGPAGSTQDHSANPTLLADIFCRVGGPTTTAVAQSCMTVNSKNVIGDNFWLWRADHDTAGHVVWTGHASKNGLVVNGDNVTMYGLFVEHFQEYQTLWNANGGRTYFYQSEIPYDPPSQAAWMNGTANGFASYKVADSVTSHELWGLGAYCNFREAVVWLENSVECPAAVAPSLHHLTSIWLNGLAGSGINHVINGTGAQVTTASRKATAN